MMANTPSATQLWERWLARLQGWSDSENRELAKFELLALLNQPGSFDDNQLSSFASLLSHCTGAEAILVYEEVNKGGAQRTPVSQVKIRATSLSRRQLEECIHTESFISHVGKNRGDIAVKLRIPIKLHRFSSPISYLYRVSLGWPLTVLFLTTAELPKLDQKFLQTIGICVKSRTVRGELSQALQAETRRLSTITHQLSEGLVILDRDLLIQTWNRPLQRLTGYSPLEAEGKLYSHVLRRVGGGNWLEKIVENANGNPSRNVFYEQIELQTKQRQNDDGQLTNSRWVNASGSFLRGENGQVIQTIILVSDISRHKELENRKNEFISIATHELRTPITAIKGYLTLLRKRAHSFGPQESSYLNRALEANDRLVRLTEDLLQVVRVEENRVPYTLRPVDLAVVAEQVVKDFSERASQKGLRLIFERPNFPTTVIADRERIEQIYANLVDNAIKYTPKGTVTVSFDQTLDRLTKERHIVSVVADTGIGLSNREINTVFEKFHRTNKARETREVGTGLGLFIVKSFVEKQGGTIKVRSGFRRGSEFIITLPALDTGQAVSISTKKRRPTKAKN